MEDDQALLGDRNPVHFIGSYTMRVTGSRSGGVIVSDSRKPSTA
jgi:hypothetical protein